MIGPGLWHYNFDVQAVITLKRSERKERFTDHFVVPYHLPVALCDHCSSADIEEMAYDVSGCLCGEC